MPKGAEANGCSVDDSWGAWFMANRRLWEGMSLPRRPKKHWIAVVCGDVKETFGVDLVRAAVRQGETMYCALRP